MWEEVLGCGVRGVLEGGRVVRGTHLDEGAQEAARDDQAQVGVFVAHV